MPESDAHRRGPHDWERDYLRQFAGRRKGRSVFNLWLGDVLLDQAQLTQPLRFGLWELMVGITVAAVLFALFRTLGIFGAVIAFVAAAIVTQFVFPSLAPAKLARQEVMFDFVWALVMPLLCLVFDPFIFKMDETNLYAPWFGAGMPNLNSPPTTFAIQFYPYSFPVYSVIACQLGCFGLWLLAGRLPADVSAVWAGILWVGFAISCVIGVVLLLPSVFGLALFGIGALGFTPLFTARAFYRRALLAGSIAMRELPQVRAERLAVLGYYLAFLLPAAVGIAAWIAISILRGP
jgi:hypothetical protein